jgi:peptide/nickel transport system substrate-binding protein
MEGPVRFRLIKLRFRRRLRKGQQQVEVISQQAERNIEKHFFRRFERLMAVRRFVFGWMAVLILMIGILVVQNLSLSNYFQTLTWVPGGIYNEGVVGNFTNANPLYATSSVDTTVSRLIFAGLFKYNSQNQLVGDLASDYTVDAKGLVYTVHLKPNLKWQDSKPLTSADVVFTYQTIQNPDALSSLQSSWQGIKVSAPDASTVIFTLPDTLSSFAFNLTNGIVPKHILAKVPIADLRSSDFNTLHPVGAGPFIWQSIQVSGSNPLKVMTQVTLLPFKNYHSSSPKLQQFIVHSYANENDLIKALMAGQLTGAQGLNQIPNEASGIKSLQVHSIILSAAAMVFFKTSSGVLSDSKVRSGLVQSADVPNIIKSIGYSTAQVREPILSGQIGYDPSLRQSASDIKAAQATLDSAGWVVGKDGIRTKDGKILTFRLTAANTAEYHTVIDRLQKDWLKVGVKLQPQFLSTADFQSALSQHDYDAVLYGISIGVDPDVFVYWDSSQADIRSANRLNLSEYKNTTADAALESGRTRLNPALRAVKYKPFLQAWQQDNPALGLYQPRSLYLTYGTVSGLTDQTINTPTDRLNNVENWQIRQSKVTN